MRRCHRSVVGHGRRLSILPGVLCDSGDIQGASNRRNEVHGHGRNQDMLGEREKLGDRMRLSRRTSSTRFLEATCAGAFQQVVLCIGQPLLQGGQLLLLTSSNDSVEHRDRSWRKQQGGPSLKQILGAFPAQWENESPDHPQRVDSATLLCKFLASWVLDSLFVLSSGP